MEQTEAMKDKTMESGDSMPPKEPTILAKAIIVARAHEVKGEALLVKAGDQNVLDLRI